MFRQCFDSQHAPLLSWTVILSFDSSTTPTVAHCHAVIRQHDSNMTVRQSRSTQQFTLSWCHKCWSQVSVSAHTKHSSRQATPKQRSVQPGNLGDCSTPQSDSTLAKPQTVPGGTCSRPAVGPSGLGLGTESQLAGWDWLGLGTEPRQAGWDWDTGWDWGLQSRAKAKIMLHRTFQISTAILEL